MQNKNKNKNKNKFQYILNFNIRINNLHIPKLFKMIKVKQLLKEVKQGIDQSTNGNFSSNF